MQVRFIIPAVAVTVMSAAGIAQADTSSMIINLVNNSSCTLIVEYANEGYSDYWMQGLMPQISTAIKPHDTLRFGAATNDYNSGESGALSLQCDQISKPITLQWSNPANRGDPSLIASPSGYTQIQLNESAGILHPQADVEFNQPAESFDASKYQVP